MRFSTKAEYGLKAIINLANIYPGQKTLCEISREENISPKYLERLMGVLRKNNLIISRKGKNGGYTLAKNPAYVNIGEIIETLEGPIAPMKCVGKHCIMEKKCASSAVWNTLGKAIKQILYKIKLNNLVNYQKLIIKK
jgi:Rrf2 family protein